MTELEYNEWPLIYKAVEGRRSLYWSLLDKFNPEDDLELWNQVQELAEDHDALLDKIDKMANEQFPIVGESVKNEAEIYPGEDQIDLDSIRLDE